MIDKWGKLDILVNNAGVIRDSLLATLSEENWLEVIATNLNSVYNFCQAVTRQMMSQRYGRMINISSVSADFGNPGQANYAASKGGVDGFTHCVAAELAKRNITVNAVSPGFIETDMTLAVRNAAGDQIVKRIPGPPTGKAGGRGPCRRVSRLGGVGLHHGPGPAGRRRADAGWIFMTVHVKA